MPYIIRHNAGQGMYDRLKDVILSLKAKGEEFGTYKEFAERVTQ